MRWPSSTWRMLRTGEPRRNSAGRASQRHCAGTPLPMPTSRWRARGCPEPEGSVNKPLPTIRSIQYIRGIAALMVVWHHAPQQVPGLDHWFPVFLDEFGSSGVDLFFVLSGFIMAMTTRRSGVSPLGFMARRILRVAPLYWLLTLLMVGCALVLPSLFNTLVIAPDTLVKSLLFIPHYSASFSGAIWPLLVPGWTLNYEMFFYLVFALCLCLPVRWRAVALLVSMALLVGANVFFGPFASAVASAYSSPILLEFALGVIIGELHAAGKLKVHGLVALAAVILGCFILLARKHLPGAPYLPFAGAGLVIAGALALPWANRSNRWLQTLGDASYSIYLTHIFTLGALRVIWTRLNLLSPSLEAAGLWLLVSLITCAVAGVLCYWWVEKPIGALVSAGLKRMPSSGQPRLARDRR
ncbi:MAG: acyltransferase [Comamonadaceae bacterium]|nr:MAG: acyltransferase [Comamonadaceae bacterium]